MKHKNFYHFSKVITCSLVIISSLYSLQACKKGASGSELNESTKTQKVSKKKDINPAYIPPYCDDLANPCSDPKCAKYYDCGPSDPSATYAGVNITYETASGMLRFNNESDVNTVLNQLEADYDLYNDNYDSQYPNYTADQMDSIDVVNNFDEFKKFRDFETLFPGFSSKRKQIENTEIAWLNNNFTGTDPDVIDLSFDNAENTIFNSSNSFKVGSSVYELRSDGLYINGVLQGGGGTIGTMSTSGATCYSGKAKGNYYPTGTNKRYELKVAVHSIGFRSSAKGKVVSFKPKSGGGWKRSRSEMAVSAAGNIYTSQCAFNFSLNIRKPSPSGYKNRKELEVPYRQYGAGGQVIYKTMDHEFASAFTLKSGYASPSLYL